MGYFSLGAVCRLQYSSENLDDLQRRSICSASSTQSYLDREYRVVLELFLQSRQPLLKILISYPGTQPKIQYLGLSSLKHNINDMASKEKLWHCSRSLTNTANRGGVNAPSKILIHQFDFVWLPSVGNQHNQSFFVFGAPSIGQC